MQKKKESKKRKPSYQHKNKMKTKNTPTDTVSMTEIQEVVQMFDLTHPLGHFSAIDKLMVKFNLTREDAENRVMQILEKAVSA